MLKFDQLTLDFDKLEDAHEQWLDGAITDQEFETRAALVALDWAAGRINDAGKAG